MRMQLDQGLQMRLRELKHGMRALVDSHFVWVMQGKVNIPYIKHPMY